MITACHKNLKDNTYLLLQLLPGEHGELVAEYLLRVEDLLVVHLLDEGVVLDPVRLQELHVGHLERLADRLRDELGLRKYETKKQVKFWTKLDNEKMELVEFCKKWLNMN